MNHILNPEGYQPVVKEAIDELGESRRPPEIRSLAAGNLADSSACSALVSRTGIPAASQQAYEKLELKQKKQRVSELEQIIRREAEALEAGQSRLVV